MATHRAAILPTKGALFTIQARPTPPPSPGELLIAVKSIALNPADIIMRNTGLFIPSYPTVTGFDMAGLVLEVGEDVPSAFKPGTRVAAYSASAWKGCNPDYGAFQEICLVPWQHAAILPQGISWHHAATLPVAVQVPLSAWDAMGIPRTGKDTASGIEKREALLIWGASSSVGTMGVQTARILRVDPSSFIAAVYAVAGAENLNYVRSLGADRVFDYKDPCVVDAIISAARQDGLVIKHCFLATGDLASCQAVLRGFIAKTKTAKIASAPPVPSDAEVIEGLETIFVMPSNAEEERLEQFRSWMTWLSENIEKGTIRPSPEPKVVGKGLEAINEGLDELALGVSCTKLVVEVSW
ncbi:zinc-binding alcohol dehydrogenase family protein [Aspergillus mulundensis]|uniref:Alcohol dehydrogenase GroES-like protein n=1 Tax=Aspergillus mulundensis TaxID=1810919 RepID=A0A3D8T519_9EURO|nr:Alcohol dehydrogenase GroES-like protein [Aspergillus mulundensis]RDW93629.1 Alcohol dehydrogenase GroES-like protein [Aspergillus mulundensis]